MLTKLIIHFACIQSLWGLLLARSRRYIHHLLHSAGKLFVKKHQGVIKETEDHSQRNHEEKRKSSKPEDGIIQSIAFGPEAALRTQKICEILRYSTERHAGECSTLIWQYVDHSWRQYGRNVASKKNNDDDVEWHSSANNGKLRFFCLVPCITCSIQHCTSERMQRTRSGGIKQYRAKFEIKLACRLLQCATLWESCEQICKSIEDHIWQPSCIMSCAAVHLHPCILGTFLIGPKDNYPQVYCFDSMKTFMFQVEHEAYQSGQAGREWRRVRAPSFSKFWETELDTLWRLMRLKCSQSLSPSIDDKKMLPQ